MTIAVACNLADGVVLGADSAVTMEAAGGGVVKVYNDAEKLFTLYNMPVAMVTFGTAVLGKRTIQSHVREFEATHNPDEISRLSLEEVCRHLWEFLHPVYLQSMQEIGIDAASLPIEERPSLGLLVGGFGPGQYLSEIWELIVPSDDVLSGVICKRNRGSFGSVWKGMTDGIVRFHKGFSLRHLNAAIGVILQSVGVTNVDPALDAQVTEILASAEYTIPFDGMPLQEGVDYVRFLLDMMINQTRFVIGAPMCGGRVRLAVVQTTGVQLVTNNGFATS